MTEISNLEYRRTYEQVGSPDAYAPFSLINGRVLLGCIDPRPEQAGADYAMPVTLQSPGGASGEVDDAVIVDRALGDGWTREQHAAWQVKTRTEMIVGGHGQFGDICAYRRYSWEVLDEIANPNEQTQAITHVIGRRYVDMGDLHSAYAGVRDGARWLLDEMQETANGASLDTATMEYFDNAYPDQNNIVKVMGENRGGMYVVNHHTRMGLNRQKLHYGHSPALEVTAYHDSLGAGIAELPSHVSRLQLPYRVAARVMRSAATLSTLIDKTAHDLILVQVEQVGSQGVVYER